MRINKLFSNFGICSRKDVNKLIEDKRIKVNGQLCIPGQWVEENDEILLDDKTISKMENVYIIFNKPVGITTTSEKKVKENIIDFIDFPQYIFPIGRLDKDSQGLIMLTNDGNLANKILDSDNEHEKEYIVKLDKPFDDEFIKKMSNGVSIPVPKSSHVKRISDTEGISIENGKKRIVLLNEIKSKDKLNNFNNNEVNKIINSKDNHILTRKCEVSRVSDDTFKIILTQGLNRQIRKMSGALGYKVLKLERIRIMNIKLNDLKCGELRKLKEEELLELQTLLK